LEREKPSSAREEHAVSVASVDERWFAWMCVEESEGEKKER
jgi:hypothetical protein